MNNKTEKYSQICPECGIPLSYAMEGLLFTVWCGHGPCPSNAANNGGASFESYDAAYADLQRCLEESDLPIQENP